MLAFVLSLAVTAPPSGPTSPAMMLWQFQGCHSCHGVDGRGDTDLGKDRFVTDMTKLKWHRRLTDAQMTDAIIKGIDRKVKGKHLLMAAYELQPHQVKQLIDLIRSWAPKKRKHQKKDP